MLKREGNLFLPISKCITHKSLLVCKSAISFIEELSLTRGSFTILRTGTLPTSCIPIWSSFPSSYLISCHFYILQVIAFSLEEANEALGVTTRS
jgi:hypothetical protein